MTAAIVEAEVEAELHAQWLAGAEIRYGHDPDAQEKLKAMRSAVATINRCAERMKTCKPQSRFAYAAHITKANRKLNQADNDLRRYA